MMTQTGAETHTAGAVSDSALSFGRYLAKITLYFIRICYCAPVSKEPAAQAGAGWEPTDTS